MAAKKSPNKTPKGAPTGPRYASAHHLEAPAASTVNSAPAVSSTSASTAKNNYQPTESAASSSLTAAQYASKLATMNTNALKNERKSLEKQLGKDTIIRDELSNLTDRMIGAGANANGALAGGVYGFGKGVADVIGGNSGDAGALNYIFNSTRGGARAGSAANASGTEQLTQPVRETLGIDRDRSFTAEQRQLLDRYHAVDEAIAPAAAAERYAKKEVKAEKFENARSSADYTTTAQRGMQRKDAERNIDYTALDAVGSAFCGISTIAKLAQAAKSQKDMNNPALYAYTHAGELIENDRFGSGGISKGILNAEYLYMTDDEVAVYSYWLEKEGRKKADEYVKSIHHRLQERRAEQQYTNEAEWAADHPAAASALSVATGLGNVGSYVNNEIQQRIAPDAPADPYSPLTRATRLTNALREGAQKGLSQGAGAQFLKSKGMSEENVTQLTEFLYGTGMSMADCATQAWIFGPDATLYVMSAEAAGQNAQQSAELGISSGDAAAMATVAGAAEYVTEMLPLENLFRLAEGGGRFLTRETVGNILKQAGMEATEELCSSYMDTLADISINGSSSQYAMYIENCVRGGMSREEAERAADYEFFFLQPMQDAAGGALSGAGFGVGGSAIGAYNTYQAGANTTAEAAAQMARATQDADLTARADALGQDAGAMDRGELAVRTQQYIANLTPAQQTAVQLRYKQATGQELSAGQTAALRLLTGEQLPQSEILSLRDGSMNDRAQFEQLTGLDLGRTDISTLTAQTTAAAKANEQNAAPAEQGAAMMVQADEAQAAQMQNVRQAPALSAKAQTAYGRAAETFGRLGIQANITADTEAGIKQQTAQQLAAYVQQSGRYGALTAYARDAGTTVEQLLHKALRDDRVTVSGKAGAQIEQLTGAKREKGSDKVNGYSSTVSRRAETSPTDSTLTDTDGDTISKEQAEYFKDSVIRNADGRLIKMYHGTPTGNFTVFDIGRAEFGSFGGGFYFTSDRQEAEGRYMRYSDKSGSDFKTYEVYLNVTNPMPYSPSLSVWNDIIDRLDIDRSAKEVLLEGISSEADDGGSVAFDTFRDYVEMNDVDISASDWVSVLKGMGYDGFVTIDPSMYGTRIDPKSKQDTRTWNTHVVAFDANQIKNIDNRKPTDSSDIRYMSKKSSNADYSDYDAPITESDIQTLRSIGRKSINEFTSEDIRKSQKLAYKFWQQLGTKSPFFRAWFGDWRAHDTSTITIVKEADATRGSAINSDTGWEINISGKVFGETQSHNSTRSNKAKAFLPFIRSIVDHAVLLDTTVIPEKDKKSDNSLYMHSFYAIADIGNGDELIKLFVEEMNDPNSSNTNKRAYKLNYIENVGKASVRVQSNTPSSLTNTLPTDYTVSDLYDLVKRYDKEFKPHEANPEFLNDDGTPKQYYHGTPNGTFTEFKDWQYFTDSSDYADVYQAQGASSNGYKRTAENPKTYAVYLKADNIFDTRNEAEREIFESEFFGQWGNGAPLSEKGLPDWTDGDDLIEFFEENGYDYDAILLDEGAVGGYGEDVVSRGVSVVIRDSSQIKSADENIGTFDKETRDIRFSAAKTTPAKKTPAKPALSEAVKRSKTGTVTLDTSDGKLSAVELDIFSYTYGDRQLTDEYRKVAVLADKTRKKVHWIAGNSVTLNGKTFPVSGGFWYNSEIYLNAENSDEAYSRVFGHEVCHDVLSRNEKALEQYYGLRRAWAERSGTTEALEDRMNDIMQNRVFDTKDDNAVFEELMCDDLGDMMQDEQFARFVVSEDRSLWQRITYAVGRVCGRLRTIFGVDSAQEREAAQRQAFMLDMLQNDFGGARLPADIRSDAARAQRTAENVRGRYQPREYRTAQQTRWTQNTRFADNQLAGVTNRRANESTKYGYQTVYAGGEMLKVFIVNPSSGRLDAQHKASVEAARGLAAATGMKIAFTTGSAIIVDKKNGEALTRRYDVLRAGDTWYINTQSTDPYTAALGVKWYDMYAAANPSRARSLARLVARVNRLTGGSTTAGQAAAQQLTTRERSSYIDTPRAIMSAQALQMSPAELLETLSSDRALARSAAQEEPSLIRRAADSAGDLIARLRGTEERRAQSIMKKVEANLLYALSDSAANNTAEEGEKIPPAKKRTALPEGMRMMSIQRNTPVKYSALRVPTNAEVRTYADEDVQQYGRIKAGENVNSRGDQNVPRRVEPGTKVRQTYRTAMESQNILQAYASDLLREVVNGSASYTPISNKAAVAYANSRLDNGYEAAMEDWIAVTRRTRHAGKNDIALGERLIQETIKRGDVQTFERLVSEVAAEATRAGQVVQAISMLKRLSPEGQLMSLHRQANNINDALARQGRDTVEIDADMERAYMKAASELGKVQREIERLREQLRRGERTENGEFIEDKLDRATKRAEQLKHDIDGMMNDMVADAAKQLPRTLPDQINAWRYLAMLGNPRTHIRNLTGNLVFAPAVMAKNALAGLVEDAVGSKLEERTKTLLRRTTAAQRDFARNDADQMKAVLQGNGKYNSSEGQSIKDEQLPLNNEKLFGKVLNRASGVVGDALETEDWWFLRPHYVHALGNYMAANKLTPADMEADNAKLARAREYAMKEAQKATYRDANGVADFISDAARRLRGRTWVGYTLLEGVLPFKKTPANIVKRGLEYSPAGLVSAISKGSVDLAKGKITGAEYIDRLSSGLTGTGITALGLFLAALGMARGGRRDDDDLYYYEKAQGAQDYSLVFGDTSYTIDWMAPASLPFFVGVELYRTIKGDWSEATVADMLDALSGITEPIFNLSMLDGLSDTLQSFSSDGYIYEISLNSLESFIGQLVPTVGGQINRAADPVSRNAYYYDKTSKLPKWLQRVRNTNMQKIPGLAKLLPEKVDMWGRVVRDDSTVSRIAQNFASPGYWKTRNTTEVDAMIEELYEATGDNKIIPKTAPTYFSFKGETYNMSAEEYVQFAQDRGQTAFSVIDGMMRTAKWKDATDEEKSGWIKDAYDYANAYAKSKTASGYKLEKGQYKWWAKARDSGDPATYIINRK